MSLLKHAFASARVIAIASVSSASERTTRIPRPPPPPDALMITGKPMRLACALFFASSSSRGPSEPGTQGTPAFFIDVIADTLSPIMRMVSALGPTKIKPLRSTCSAKSAFSDRKP